MRLLYWLAAGAVGLFVVSGRKAAPAVPETIRRDSFFPDATGYNEEVAADPALRAAPTALQMFGSDAFFSEAKRRQTDWTYPPPGQRDITPIYEKSLADGTVRLVGDLMPSGDYYPKGSATALDLRAIDPRWMWR